MSETDVTRSTGQRADEQASEPVAIDLTDDDAAGEDAGADAARHAPTKATKSATGADDADRPPCDDLPLGMRIEALLLASDRPLSTGKLGELLGIDTRGLGKRIKDEIEQLNAAYETTGRSFRIEQIAGGWQLYTIEAVGPLVARQHTHRQSNRLSQAALETLSIIAYRQPILRAEIEAIRGVASGEVLRGLLDRRLVAIVGRAEELGRPMLYGTTRFFLEVFGLNDLDDLPPVEGLTPGEASASNKRADKTTTSAKAADSPDGDDADGEAEADIASPVESDHAAALDDATDVDDATASGDGADKQDEDQSRPDRA